MKHTSIPRQWSCPDRDNDGAHCAYNLLDAPQVPSDSFPDNMQTKPKFRYALGRTNHDPDGGYGTSKFHVNNYFACVTAVQMSNRQQWIAEIK